MIFVKNSRGGREVNSQHDQNFVKNKFVKNRVGGREANLNLDNVFKYTVFFLEYPQDIYASSVMARILVANF